MYLNRVTLIRFIGNDAKRKVAGATNLAIFTGDEDVLEGRFWILRIPFRVASLRSIWQAGRLCWRAQEGCPRGN
jgi:hypothetical protein